MSMRHDINLIFIHSFVELIFKKKSVTNLGTKLYKQLPNYIKNLENLKPFKKQLKAFFITTDLLFSGRILIIHSGKKFFTNLTYEIRNVAD
jgi:hypothetical protein